MPVNAVVEIGGKQHSVVEGGTLKVEVFDKPAGETVTLDKVLAVVDGENTLYGRPYVEGAAVEAKILKHGRNKKVMVFKYKPKKRVRTLRGHRQNYSLIKVESIRRPQGG